ncbi:MAG: taurine ABC transporter permease TauC [Acetobacteraceae bacterium]
MPRVPAWVPAWAATASSLAVLLAAWLVLSWGGVVSDLFLPGPELLWSALLDLLEDGYKSRSLWEHVADSLVRVLAGFGLGAAAGTMLGLAMGTIPTLDAICAPFIEFLRPLPQLAYLVLLIVWLGIGETSKITLLFLAALPVSAIAARDGVRNVDPVRLAAARSLGANPVQVFRYVVFPSAMAEIFTGARLAIGIVYGTLIAAEIIAGSTGIGWLILDAGRFLRSDYVFVGILIIGVMGVALDRLLLALELRVVHWAGKA